MLTWLSENIVIIVALVAVLTLVIYKMVKDKKNGRSSCGCGCGSCAMKNECDQKK